MSVYTNINQQQLEQFLKQYSLGELIQYTGIQAGIENTNYAVVTSQGKYILTIYEALSANELPQFLNYLKYLNYSSFPAPCPQKSQTGHFINSLKSKPAAFFNCIIGHSIENPSADQCGQIGRYLAKLHVLGKQYSLNMEPNKKLTDYITQFNKIKSFLSHEKIDLLESELAYQLSFSLPDLPQGIIHADLFTDNVLFNQGRISGVLDFYNACQEVFIFDIAITCNDWCSENNKINTVKYEALLSGYEKIRTLTHDERRCLPLFLRRAALRFWLSRLDHQLNPKLGDLTLIKDPAVFRRLLNYHKTKHLHINH